PDERIEHPLFRLELRPGLDVLALAALDQADRDLNQVADDLLDIPPDITDLGEFRRLDLKEWRAGQFRQPPRDLGLAATVRSDHQNVLRHHFLAHRRGQTQTAP